MNQSINQSIVRPPARLCDAHTVAHTGKHSRRAPVAAAAVVVVAL
jgi:hypothetical protein